MSSITLYRVVLPARSRVDVTEKNYIKTLVYSELVHLLDSIKQQEFILSKYFQKFIRNNNSLYDYLCSKASVLRFPNTYIFFKYEL